MKIDLFLRNLMTMDTPEKLKDFTQRHILHGTPFVFSGREDEFFDFKKRLKIKFNVNINDIYVIGSAKLGFSPHKRTDFDLNSDIDLAIVSDDNFSNIISLASQLEFKIRSQHVYLRRDQWQKYHKFLRYLIIGWMRPDLLPRAAPCIAFADDWFGFFEGLSNGKSEIGNYKVTAGIFRTYSELERYALESMTKVQQTSLVGENK
jgi:hypothetical protein